MNEAVLTLAKEHGFDLAGVSPAQLNENAFDHYKGWVKAGRAGEMAYMERDPERRQSVNSIMPEAKSVISLAVNYYRPSRPGRKGDTGQIARYAYGRDYHKIMGKMLKRLSIALTEQFPDHQFRSYVDTGAVLEKSYAEQAGLGYTGKNTTLITPTHGSWVFLSEIITTLPLTPTPSEKDTCGHCRLCLDICPTGALVAPNELDSRKCISYLTIENRGPIPEELRPLIGDWLYGCDLCQEVCPKNSVAQKLSNDELVAKRIGGDTQELKEILELETKEQFDERYAGSPIRRAKREGLVRNACVVAANIGASSLLPQLQKLASEDESDLVREHANWAIRQLESKP
jgi:epoxyqueuosine reductase